MRAVLRRAAFLVTAAGHGGTMRRLAAAATVPVAAIGLSLVSPGAALASTVTVTNCSSSGTGSLPDAVTNAAAGDTITFDPSLSCGLITLNNTLTIAKSLTITGPGAAIMALSGAGSFTVLQIDPGAAVSISGLTIENGVGMIGNGGGIDNQGTLALTNSTVSGNTASTDFGSQGGGIYNDDSAVLTLTGSTVSGNSATGSQVPNSGGGIVNTGGVVTLFGSTVSGNTSSGDSGGIDNEGGTSLVTLVGSTVSGNVASDGAGGIFNGGTADLIDSTLSGNTVTGSGLIVLGGGGGIYSNNTLILRDSTVTGNKAGNDGGGIFAGGGTVQLAGSTVAGNSVTGSGTGVQGGGGIYSTGGAVNLGGTIVAGNTSASGTGPNCANLSTPPTSDGYNLTDDTLTGSATATACGLTPMPGGTDVVGANPLLGPLADNGGPTLTLMPGSGSPAIGIIPDPTAGLCPATDQRGYTTAVNTACDAGAVQTSGSAPALTTMPDPGTVTLGTSTPLNDTATLSGGISPTGTITFTLHDPNNIAVYTDHVPVNGSGTYSTTDASGDNPGGFTPTTLAGTWQWDASYSGDAANGQLSDTGDPAEHVTVNPALYGFGGFMAPVPKSTLTYKAGSAIPVKFVLTDASGQPIPAATAANLAAGKQVEATLSGPGTSTTVLAQAFCTWNTTYLFFQCNLKTPSRLKTGKTNPYKITALENLSGGGFVPAPGTANPETIFFK